MLFSDEAGICFSYADDSAGISAIYDETGICLSCADDGAGIFALF